MPEDEETPGAPGWFGDGILENGQNPGAVRRAAIREANARRQQAEAARAAQKGQERAERPQRVHCPREACAAAQRPPCAPCGRARGRARAQWAPPCWPGPTARGPALKGRGAG